MKRCSAVSQRGVTYHSFAQAHVSLTAIHNTVWEWLSTSALADRQTLHIFLQIHVEELENEVKLVAVGVHDVKEAHDVDVVHFLKERDLADCGGGDPLVFGFETDLLKSDNTIVGEEVAGFVYDAICACVVVSVDWQG